MNCYMCKYEVNAWLRVSDHGLVNMLRSYLEYDITAIPLQMKCKPYLNASTIVDRATQNQGRTQRLKRES